MSKQIFDCPEILGESLVNLTEAAKHLPVPCSRATIERWVRRGARGTRLETVLIANRRYTSIEAIHRFLVNQQHTAPEKARPEHPVGNISPQALFEAARRFGLPEPDKNSVQN